MYQQVSSQISQVHISLPTLNFKQRNWDPLEGCLWRCMNSFTEYSGIMGSPTERTSYTLVFKHPVASIHVHPSPMQLITTTSSFSTRMGLTRPSSGVHHYAKPAALLGMSQFVIKIKLNWVNPNNFQLKPIKSHSSCGYRLLVITSCLPNFSCAKCVFVLSCSTWMYVWCYIFLYVPLWLQVHHPACVVALFLTSVLC